MQWDKLLEFLQNGFSFKPSILYKQERVKKEEKKKKSFTLKRTSVEERKT